MHCTAYRGFTQMDFYEIRVDPRSAARCIRGVNLTL